jgi:hypothetical protein
MPKKSTYENKDLREILETERQAIYSEIALEDNGEEKLGPSTEVAQVFVPTPAKLSRFPHPIPLDGLDAPITKRIKSRLLDYILVGVPLFLMDGLFHLTRVASFFLGDLGLKPEECDFIVTLTPKSWGVFVTHPAALLKILLFVFLVLLGYRLFFYYFARRTMGQLFTSTMLTNREGRYPSVGNRMTKAVVSTLADAVLIGTLLDGLFYLITKPHMSVTDAVSGIRAVRQDDWAKITAQLLDRMTHLRRKGVT